MQECKTEQWIVAIQMAFRVEFLIKTMEFTPYPWYNTEKQER